MSVDSVYYFEQFVNDGETIYTFKYESIGETAIEAYSVLDGDPAQRILLDLVWDYTLELEEAEAPTYKGGTITLVEPIPAGRFLQVERKTPIISNYLAVAGQPFEPLQFEFVMDRICFIQQEIEGSKCDCREPAPPPVPEPEPDDCKEYECDAYNTYLTSVATNYYPMTNGFTGLSVADEGSNYPNDTLMFDAAGSVDLESFNIEAVHFSATAGGSFSCTNTAYENKHHTGTANWWDYADNEGWPAATKGSGAIGCVVKYELTAGTGTFIRLSGAGTNTEFIGFTRTGIEVTIWRDRTSNNNSFVLSLPPVNADGFSNVTVNWYPAGDPAFTVFEVYSNHVLFSSAEHEGDPAGQPTPDNYYRVGVFATGGQVQQDVWVIQGAGYSPASAKAVWDQSQPDYIDPDCSPVAVPIFVGGVVQTGYGQDRNIAVGATETEMMINPDGHGPLQYTDDGGATWTPISWSSDTPARICQDMHKVAGSEYWYILGYREDNRADRSWQHQGVPDGTWVFTNDKGLSYNHGVHYQDADTYWRYNGQNNGPGKLTKYADQTTGTPVVFNSANIPVGGQRNGWIHRKVGANLFITRQHINLDGYMVWDISADIPVFVGDYDAVLNFGRNMATSGTSAICTATAAQGGTAGTSAIIQHLDDLGNVTDTTMDFGVVIDLVCCHYENAQFLITAVVASDPSVMRYGWGTSGTYTNQVALPYPASTKDDQRDVRFLGNGSYAVGYLAVVGGDDGVLVVFTVNLDFTTPTTPPVPGVPPPTNAYYCDALSSEMFTWFDNIWTMRDGLLSTDGGVLTGNKILDVKTGTQIGGPGELAPGLPLTLTVTGVLDPSATELLNNCEPNSSFGGSGGLVEAYDPGGLAGSVVGFPLTAGSMVAITDASETGEFGIEWDGGSQYIRFNEGLRCIDVQSGNSPAVHNCRTGGLLNLLDNGNDFALVTWENLITQQTNGSYNQSVRIKVYDSTGFAVQNFSVLGNLGYTQAVFDSGTGSWTAPATLNVTDFRLTFSENSWQDAGFSPYTASDITAADTARAARRNLTTF